jgi:hypothetical protein
VAVDNGNVDVMQELWKMVRENLTTEEIKNRMILSTDRYGRRAWHVAARYGNLDLMQEIWECSK